MNFDKYFIASKRNISDTSLINKTRDHQRSPGDQRAKSESQWSFESKSQDLSIETFAHASVLLFSSSFLAGQSQVRSNGWNSKQARGVSVYPTRDLILRFRVKPPAQQDHVRIYVHFDGEALSVYRRRTDALGTVQHFVAYRRFLSSVF